MDAQTCYVLCGSFSCSQRYFLPMQRVEEIVAAACEQCGVGLFDLDYPSAGGGTLRVFLMHKDGSTSGVTVDECARVNRILAENVELDEIYPAGISLEVSSPGVNRRLRTSDHFRTAVGERIRVSFQEQESSGRASSGEVVGVLKSYEDAELVVVRESTKSKSSELAGEVRIPFGNVRNARVDFKF